MFDVLIVGGGPAGAIAGVVAARAGARVRILDRAVFPRDKLCGDTINPGALARLQRLGIAGDIVARGLPVGGMIVTGENGVRIAGHYPAGLEGCALLRRHLDARLIQAAVEAGCQFEEGVAVERAILTTTAGGAVVSGVRVQTATGVRSCTAPVVIAADGRRSRLGFGLGLARHPPAPRRWAIGAYFTGVGQRAESRGQSGAAVCGEMHVRSGCYVGVAPLPDGLTNVCLVRPAGGGDPAFRDPSAVLRATIANDPILRDRLAGGTLAGPPVVLGPLAVDATGAALDGLVVAGDAAGFIDPMTGDGLRFAIHGGELAALAALQALEHGWRGVHAGYAVARRQAFGSKWRFDRALRALVASPRTLAAAAAGARLAPAAIRAVIARAGDCHVAA